MHNSKHLVIGSSGHSFVHCIPWDIRLLPNLRDYDTILVNVRSLDSEKLKFVSSEQMRHFREKITLFLESRGTLIVLSDIPKRSIVTKKESAEVFSNWDWSPIQIKIVEESGKSIGYQNGAIERFPKYFSKFTEWTSFFESDFSYSEEFYKCFGIPRYGAVFHKPTMLNFSTNRYNKILSGLFTVGSFYRRTKEQEALLIDGEYFPKKPDKVTGPIIFLPLISDLDLTRAVNLVLEDLLGKPQTALPPEWVSKVPMSLVGEIDRELYLKQTVIQQVKMEIEVLEKRKQDLEFYKKLLYCDGKELENIFKTCLEKLGATVNPPKNLKDEEYILSHTGFEYPVEAKGVSKSVSMQDLRQLIDYTLSREISQDQKCRGILLGNAWKTLALDQRGTGNKPEFPDNVVQRAIEMKIALVSSVDFFHIFNDFLESKVLAHDILDVMVNTPGRVYFKKLKC